VTFIAENESAARREGEGAEVGAVDMRGDEIKIVGEELRDIHKNEVKEEDRRSGGANGFKGEGVSGAGDDDNVFEAASGDGAEDSAEVRGVLNAVEDR